MVARIEFQRDDRQLREDLKHDPVSASAAALEENYFLLPVRFTVNSTELFAATQSNPWMVVGVLGLCSHLYETMATIRSGQTKLVSIGDGGSLSLYRDKDLLHLESAFASVELPFDDALSAAAEFRSRIRKLIEEVMPQLRSHPHWHRWFGQPTIQ